MDKFANLRRDLGMIALSIFIAVILAESGAIAKLVSYSASLEVFSSFIAGIFFTSVFTTAPAIVALFEISQTTPILHVAFFGALGALVGDLVIFRFFKNRISEDMVMLLSRSGRLKLKYLLKISYLRWLMIFVGGLIIASPLPDELGLMLMGFSKLDSRSFGILSFVFNFLGILAIGYFAR